MKKSPGMWIKLSDYILDLMVTFLIWGFPHRFFETNKTNKNKIFKLFAKIKLKSILVQAIYESSNIKIVQYNLEYNLVYHFEYLFEYHLEYHLKVKFKVQYIKCN